MEREQLVGEGNSDSDSEVAGTSKGSSDERAVPERRVSEGDKEPPRKHEYPLRWALHVEFFISHLSMLSAYLFRQ